MTKKFTITEYFIGANGFETSEERLATPAEAAKILKNPPAADAGYTVKVKSANAARTKFGYFNKRAEAVKPAAVVEPEEDFLAVLLGEVA